jgi:hypothetical protein
MWAHRPLHNVQNVQNVQSVQNQPFEKGFEHFEQIEQRTETATASSGACWTLVSSFPDSDIGDDLRSHIAPLLSGPSPDGISVERWDRACNGAAQFARNWAAQAMRLGWSLDELFRLAEPFARVDLQGAAWFIGDSTVVAVSAGAITIRTPNGAIQRLYRGEGEG